MRATDTTDWPSLNLFFRSLRWAGALLGLACLAALAIALLPWLETWGGADRTRLALLGGATAAAATGLGTLPVLLSKQLSQRSYDCFLGFGAGVMLAASAFSLIVPALAATRAQGAGPIAASASVGGGIILGAMLILLLDRVVRLEHLFDGTGSAASHTLRRTWLFVLAVALHNLPEGMAIGVAYAGIDIDKANTLTTGISIQDIPEGLVVALALRGAGYGRLFAAALGVLSGLIEPVAALAGVFLIGTSSALLPWGLAAAAGAMLFVIQNDVMPEAHRNGSGTAVSCSLLFGFVLMTVLDTALS